MHIIVHTILKVTKAHFHLVFYGIQDGHLNYENIHLLKINGVSGFPTIPRKLKQCDACILGKHRKQPFHDFVSKAHRNIALAHFDLCGPLHVPSTNGNRYVMTFIDDYTKMCWVYLLKRFF